MMPTADEAREILRGGRLKKRLHVLAMARSYKDIYRNK